MQEAMPENFSTTLVCLYFAAAFERGLELLQPRVWLAPAQPRAWRDFFDLDRNARVWMCRDLLRILGDRDIPVTKEHVDQFGALKPDVWLEDAKHAIIIENKIARHRAEREAEYLMFLREHARTEKRAYLYSVPAGWAIDGNPAAEWWQFVGQPDENVLRGIIKWDAEFVQQLCSVLKVPQLFHERLPHRIGERFLRG